MMVQIKNRDGRGTAFGSRADRKKNHPPPPHRAAQAPHASSKAWEGMNKTQSTDQLAHMGLGQALGNEQVQSAVRRLQHRAQSIRMMTGGKLNANAIDLIAMTSTRKYYKKELPVANTRAAAVRLRVWTFMNDSFSDSYAFLWSLVIMGLIVASCAAFVVESDPKICCGRYDHIWDPLELVCVVFFSIEFVGRFAACPVDYGVPKPEEEARPIGKKGSNPGDCATTNKYDPKDEEQARQMSFEALTETPYNHLRARLRFMTSFLNIVDFVAIIPYYIALIIESVGEDTRSSSFAFLRVIRVMRVFRLLKLSKYSEGLQLLGSTLKRSLPALGMLAAFEAIFIVIISTAIYMIERGVFCAPACADPSCDDMCAGTANDGVGWYAELHVFTGSTYRCPAELASTGAFCRKKSFFENIFIGAYWSITTMTTTGYGDVYPQTALGRLLGCLTMLSGLVLLALPITVISENFSNEYQSLEIKRVQQREEELNDPAWVSMTGRFVQKFLEDAKNNKETGVAIPHPASGLEDLVPSESGSGDDAALWGRDGLLPNDTQLAALDDLDALQRAGSAASSLGSFGDDGEDSKPLDDMRFRMGVSPLDASQYDPGQRSTMSPLKASKKGSPSKGAANTHASAVSALPLESAHMRSLRGPPTSASMDPSTLKQTLATVVGKSNQEEMDEVEQSPALRKAIDEAEALMDGSLSEGSKAFNAIMQLHRFPSASSVGSASSGEAGKATGDGKRRIGDSSSVVVRRGSIGVDLKESRRKKRQEENQADLMRNNMEIKKLIILHKQMILESLEELLIASTQTIVTAVTEQVRIQLTNKAAGLAPTVNSNGGDARYLGEGDSHPGSGGGAERAPSRDIDSMTADEAVEQFLTEEAEKDGAAADSRGGGEGDADGSFKGQEHREANQVDGQGGEQGTLHGTAKEPTS